MHKTKHKSSDLNPKYDDTFAFDMSPYHDPNVQFAVNDYDNFSSPDPMGSIFVNMHSLIGNGDGGFIVTEKRIMRDLEGVEGCVNPTGDLSVKCKFYANRPFSQCNGGALSGTERN